MDRYQQGKIYRIYNTVDDSIYVGSTCKRTLAERMAQHRASIRKAAKSHYKLYQHMNSLGIDKFFIELIELFPCNSKDMLLAREGHFIKTLNANLNARVAGRSQSEWYQENKENRAEYNRNYRSENRNVISEQKKQYHNDNRQSIAERQKEYYQNNKLAILERQKQKFICECGSELRYKDKARHYKTKLHQAYVLYSNDCDGLNLIDI